MNIPATKTQKRPRANSPVARAARHALDTLPTDGSGEKRIGAAQAAVDQFLRKHEGSDEVAGLKLGQFLSESKVRPVTRENLLRFGLQVTAEGMGGSGAPLAAVALQMADLGWDGGEKSSLTSLSFDKLSRTDANTAAHPFSASIRKTDSVEARDALLNILSSNEATSLHDQAGTILSSVSKEDFKTGAKLGRQMLDQVTEASPQNPAYELTSKVLGRWAFVDRMRDKDTAEVTRAILQPGVPPDLATGASRLGAILPKLDAWRIGGERILKFMNQQHLAPIDEQKMELASTTLTSSNSSWGGGGVHSRVLAGFLGSVGQQHPEGRELISSMRHTFAAADVNHDHGAFGLVLTEAAKMMQEPQWCVALEVAAGNLDGSLRLSQTDRELTVQTLSLLENLPEGADPVVAAAMVTVLNPAYPNEVAEREVPYTLNGVKAFFDAELSNDPFTKLALENIVTNAESSEMRSLAKSVDKKRRTLPWEARPAFYRPKTRKPKPYIKRPKTGKGGMG